MCIRDRPNSVQERRYSASGAKYSPVCFCVPTPAPYNFCVLGKVAGFWPPDVKDFVREVPVNIDDKVNHSTSSSSSNIIRGEKVALKFVFSLRIKDGSGEISALIFDKDAETLLGGISPDDFHKNVELQNQVRDNLNDIIQKRNDYDFFIRSYTTVDVSNIKDGKYKRFQIFNTKLL